MKIAKRFGLTAIMALALMASVGAASASAAGFVANGDPSYAELKGTAIGDVVITAAGQNTACTASDFEYEMEEATETISASLGDGTCSGSQPLKFNGCSLSFHPGPDASPSNGTYDIGPPGCGPITTKTVLGCPLSIYPTTGASATFSNVGSGKEATVSVETGAGVTYVAGAPCSGVKQSNGVFDATWTVSATRQGDPTGFAVQSIIPAWIGIGTDEASPDFEASHYPVNIAGNSTRTGGPDWELGKLWVACSSAAYTSSLSSAAPELVVAGVYGGCTSMLGPVDVVMNGCNYVYSVVPFSWNGTQAISCPAGKTIDVLFYGSSKAQSEGKWLCKDAIGSQSGLPVAYGGAGSLTISSNQTNVSYTYTRKSFICPQQAEGFFSNGKYMDSTTLQGSY